MVAFESSLLRRLRGVLDASIMVVAVGAAGYVLLLAPQLSGGMSWATATGISYPLLGVLILMTLLAVAFTGQRRPRISVMLIAAAFAVTALTDALYTYAAVLHDFANGSRLNVGWQLEACLLVLAALAVCRHDEGADETLVRHRDHGLPLVLGGVAATIGAIALDARYDGLSGPMVVLAAYAVVALVARLALTSRDKDSVARRLEHALHEQERLAVTDPLTGLHNRRFFEEVLKIEAERARRHGAPVSLLVIDLDHFKRVNDTYGHQGGDAVLTTTSRRLAEALRAGDVLARYGGEEFVVILPETGLDDAVAVGERCRMAIGGAPIPAHGHQVAVTASVGVAVLGEHASSIEDLVRAADHALYLAKRLDRNQVRSGATAGGDVSARCRATTR